MPHEPTIQRIEINNLGPSDIMVTWWWQGAEPEGRKHFVSILAAALWIAEQEGYRA